MNICTASNNFGSCGVSFHFDGHSLETWFETYIAIYSYNNGEFTIKGFYKTYTFKNLKAAHNKFEALCKKYNIN